MAFDFSDPIEQVTLACDPGHGDIRDEYAGQGDIPREYAEAALTKWGIRALTSARRNAASKAAGPVEHAGGLIADRITEQTQAVRENTLSKIRPDLAGLPYSEALADLTGVERRKVGGAVLQAEKEAVAALAKDERDALDRATAWGARFYEARIREILVEVDGAKLDDSAEFLKHLRPNSLRDLVELELVNKALELAELPGKPTGP